MNDLKTLQQHLEFLIKLESECLASFELENDERMVSNCRRTRSTYIEIYDYVQKLIKENEKEVK